LYHGIRDAHGLTWANNKYNDDLIWGALMCIRAFQIFNDGGMKDMAINNFNIVWNRGWDSTVGGGIWWTTDRTSKNACVNAPAAICAMQLYYATGDVTFRNKAKQIMDWMRSRLYDANTGEVRGAINAAGQITEGARTYTQGTFIGAAGELHNHYPADNWRAMGQRAMDYTRTRMCNSAGLLPDEYCGADDCPGFKGIFARWACKFVKDYNLASTYGSWLNYNARQAWTYRNSSGLMWAQWWRRTSDGYLTSWETTSGVAMMNNVFLYNSGTTARGIASIESVSTDDAKLSEEPITMYPNPVDRMLSIRAEDARDSEVQLINSSGKVVLKQKMMTSELDVADLPRGFYTIVIEKHGKKEQRRFVKN
jgi:predicted alpha-1,6-mannanase (GH76 family)